ncbi:MAG TPA: alpha/beta hydrolase, partial [Xanthomonadaceae bacterium]|nr:alpha/beta hydrolase [Xanthomonadaceae bacterium]
MIRRPVWIALALLVLAYAGLCGWMYLQQRQLVYFPQFTHTPAAETDFALQLDGVVLRGWVVNPGRSAAIVYFG